MVSDINHIADFRAHDGIMNYLRLPISWIVLFIRFSLASTLKNVKIILNMKSAFFDWDTMPRLVFKGSVMSDLLLLLLLWQRSILYIWVDIVLGLGRKLYELAARFMSR